MQSKKTLKLGIVAGEHSGDRLGAEIIQALKSSYNIELFGVGGPRISQEGLKSEFDLPSLKSQARNSDAKYPSSPITSPKELGSLGK